MDKHDILLTAANVLSGKEPAKHRIRCKIRLAGFEGIDEPVFRDQAVCGGNLFGQYDETLDFCRAHVGGFQERAGSMPRNPPIADVFYYGGLMESRAARTRV